jgi:purine-binding chemotaxis protein CheW
MGNAKMAGEGQCLTFKLSDEVYALEITSVREVLDYTKITKVPKALEFMEGVINLRGGVVPVIDLRIKFDLEASQKTVDTCIIILEVTVNEEETLVGVLVDSVNEVIELDLDNIEPVPKIGMRLDTHFIKGMGKRDEEFVIVLDIDNLFSNQELLTVQAAGEQVSI